MSHEDENGYEPGGDAGLEPLGRNRRPAMSTTMQNVFDVLYEAAEPLSPDTIAALTYERASGAARFHARRAIVRDRSRQRVSRANAVAARDVSVGDAWPLWIKKLLRDAQIRDVVVRDEQGRYAPNPGKPPRAGRVDGTVYPYTREAWRETTAHERTVGEIQTMRMEAGRLLGSLSSDELKIATELAIHDYWGFSRQRGRPIDPRTVRAKLRWLLERPTTEEAQGWLMHELLRRIYDDSQQREEST